ERIDHWRGLRPDTADVVHKETVIPDSSSGPQHRIKDVAILDAEGRIGRRVIARAGEQIGSTSGQTRRSGRVERGAGGPRGGITCDTTLQGPGPAIHAAVA